METPYPVADALAAETLQDLARITGIPLADADSAARIAAGAAAAVAAVRGVSAELLFDYEPSDYLAALESLADATANLGRDP